MHPLLKVLTQRRRTNPRIWIVVLLAAAALLVVTPRLLATADTAEHDSDTDHHIISRLSPNLAELPDLTSKILVIVLQLAVVLALAKLLGWAAEAVSIPGVLGELAAGMIIGPFALGSWLKVYTHHGAVPLFPRPGIVDGLPQWPISEPLWVIAVVASIVLLFMAGLHTNLQQFFKNLAPATACAIGGVVAPFFFGAWTTTLFIKTDMLGNPMTIWSPEAMFMGAIMVATSVGITARVLSDIHKLDTAEGVTILGGAVIDDVLGILVLAIVLGMKRTGAVNFETVAIISVKAVGVWIGITAAALLLAPQIERAFERVKYAGARAGLGLALAFFCAALAEMFGLAFIIGAYSVGLGLSRTKMAHRLMEDLKSVNDFIVPIFFAAMGMLVNYSAMKGVLLFGIVISIWAVISKVFGCGLPALLWFNKRGAARIGMGMLPRGEVALIIAGIGLAERAISQSVFGVAIMMTLITTFIAPVALVPLFKGRPGRRGEPAELAPEETIAIEMPRTISDHFLQLLLATFQERGFRITYEDAESGIYQLERDGLIASINDNEGRVAVHIPASGHQIAEQIVSEAELRLVQAVRQVHEIPPPRNNPTASNSPPNFQA